MNAVRGLAVWTAVWVLISIATGQDRAVYSSQPRADTSPQDNDLVHRLKVLAGRTKTEKQSAAIRLDRQAKTGPSRSIQQVTFQPEEQRPAAMQARQKPAFLDLSTESRQPDQVQTAEPSDTDLLIRFGTWTIIILCCCGLTVLAIRRWQRTRGMLPETNSLSRVLETVALGPNRSVSLVQMRDVRAVVGCDGSGISSIVLAPEPFEHSLEQTDSVTMETENEQAA